jgi:prenyltransferase/squalene oxidase-like repeat protein
MMIAEHLKLEKQCLETARRGVEWLLGQQGPDGSWKALDRAPIDAYYKAAWAFNITGQSTAAERVLNYVKQNLLQSDGDLLPRNDTWYINVHYQYSNAWVVTGAQKQGRYDISMPALKFLLTQQDSSHGGFYSQRANAGEKKRSDTMSSGISGIACLATDQMDAARKLASHFQTITESQPEPNNRFYLTVDADGRLVTEFPDEEAFWRVIDTKQKDQCWYAVGLPFTFATLLHQATGENRYADLAKWFLDFQLRCANPWDGGSSGKAGWGCSMLYRTTGEKRYRDIALQVAKNQVNCQLPDGSFQWKTPGQATTGSAATAPSGQQGRKVTNDDFDITSEFVVWLSLIGSNLLARDIG